uniref:Negative elongation factor B n=1 Tax=Magallana gigas TaxID=29159 RepID=A0A8W8L6M7_MAGGI
MHYCTLRAELLMALHDQEVNDICSIDPCHKFTWCVDACIRDKFIDSKRSRELQGFLDGIRRGQEFVLGDLSMVLCDPFSMNTVGLSMMRNLQHCLNNESLPRDSSEIVLLVRMMGLGLGSWDMIDSQLFREPKLESSLFTKFLPMISSLMVEDHTRVLSAKLPEEPPLSATAPSDLFLTFVKENPIASFTTLYYSLQVTRMKDRVAALLCLMIISFLAYLEKMFSAIFFVCCGTYTPKFHRADCRPSWTGTQPNNEHSECVHTIYQQLTDKINAWQPSPATPQEQLDSPLMSVPTPAPL